MKKFFRSTLSTIILSLMLITFVSCGGSSSGDKDTTSNPTDNSENNGGQTPTGTTDLSGTWEFHIDNIADTERLILIQQGDKVESQPESGCYETSFTMTVNGSNVTYTNPGNDYNAPKSLTGTITNDNKTISGTFVVEEDNKEHAFRLEKEYDTKLYDRQNGTISMNGTVCNTSINLSSDVVCTIDDSYSGAIEDLEINTIVDGKMIGLEIESVEMLKQGTTLDVQGDGFQVNLKSTIINECYGYEEKTATAGTFTIEVFSGNRLKGTYDLTFADGDHVQGAMDVTFDITIANDTGDGNTSDNDGIVNTDATKFYGDFSVSNGNIFRIGIDRSNECLISSNGGSNIDYIFLPMEFAYSACPVASSMVVKNYAFKDKTITMNIIEANAQTGTHEKTTVFELTFNSDFSQYQGYIQVNVGVNAGEKVSISGSKI